MDPITLMIEEHKHIKKVLGLTRKACIQILNDTPVNYEAFYKIIDFVRNYADKLLSVRNSIIKGGYEQSMNKYYFLLYYSAVLITGYFKKTI